MGERGLVVVVVFGLVGTVILVVSWSSPMSSGAGGVQGCEMGGLGVLNFGGFNWDSVVDDWDVLRSVPGSGSVPGRGSMPSRNGYRCDWVSGTGGGMGGKVLSLGVLNFGGVDRAGTD